MTSTVIKAQVLYRVQSVEKHYEKHHNKRTVLNLPALEVYEGETLAVVGPSGAGKSTLLRLLGLLEPPSSGQLSLHTDEGEYTFTNAPIAIRRRVATVFQTPILLSRSVRANIAYSLRLRGTRINRAQAQSLIDDVLERTQMTSLARKRPDMLSGGEAQRVALARALVITPQVLLLDEPTAHLDPYNVQIIETLLREQAERFGTTLVLVTHNIMQARRIADRVAFLFNGELVEIAPAEQFFNAPSDPRTRAFISGELVC
jgi:tungstate transport system ATP-binding protein